MSTLTITNAITGQQVSGLSSIAKEQHLDHRVLLGKWMNTEATSRGFSQIEFFNENLNPEHDAQDNAHSSDNSNENSNKSILKMRAFGLGAGGEMLELATVAVDVFSDSMISRQGDKFSTRFDFTEIDVSLHGWVKQGVLVISVFNHFKNKNKGRNFFCREFFYAAQA